MKRFKPKEMKMSVYDILLILLILMSIGGFLILRVGKNDSPRATIHTEQPDTYIYTSKPLHLSFLVGNDFVVNEKTNSIVFQNKDGTIQVMRFATNFNSVKEYVSYIAEKNNFTDYTSTPMKIHGIDSMLVENIVGDNKKYRTYIMYVDHWIYTIETQQKSLFTSQDAMADSFRYIPPME